MVENLTANDCLPCPFCGSKAELYYWGGERQARCTECLGATSAYTPGMRFRPG